METEYSVVMDGEEVLISVEEEEGEVYLTRSDQQQRIRAEMEQLDDGLFRLRIGDQQLLFGRDVEGKAEELYLNGTVFEADVCQARFRDEEIGPEEAAGTGDLHAIDASIPGQVLEVSVSEGEQLDVGQTVLLLSAMKLENEIQTDKAGVVEHIHVEKDETVEKGQLLLEIRV